MTYIKSVKSIETKTLQLLSHLDSIRSLLRSGDHDVDAIREHSRDCEGMGSNLVWYWGSIESRYLRLMEVTNACLNEAGMKITEYEGKESAANK